MTSAMCAMCTEDEEIRVLSRSGGRRRLMCCRCGYAWEGGRSAARQTRLTSLFGAATVGMFLIVLCSLRFVDVA
ncbi:hypothetical protein J2S40_004423 [Nocardioides luteus]|uniref:TFIIS-type domain-containing protein n=1 Tax=Nocardioides luteus TaxID=1844 RepID=A0ABQ5SRM3_9ACTN|nr:hypothetical protein [Nocardioides luteus]GGR60481.1 hypothetical protein GCM10010197_29300 [Nocardioides luteus]GLJ66431.1 hypothetical protein GCM10017579_04670 [Nocardioides luteus]